MSEVCNKNRVYFSGVQHLSHLKFNLCLDLMSYSSTKFCGNLLSCVFSFCLVLLINQPTNQQRDRGGYMTNLVGVMRFKRAHSSSWFTTCCDDSDIRI